MPVSGPGPHSKKIVDAIYDEVLQILKENKILIYDPRFAKFAELRNERFKNLYLAIDELVELENWEAF